MLAYMAASLKVNQEAARVRLPGQSGTGPSNDLHHEIGPSPVLQARRSCCTRLRTAGRAGRGTGSHFGTRIPLRPVVRYRKEAAQTRTRSNSSHQVTRLIQSDQIKESGSRAGCPAAVTFTMMKKQNDSHRTGEERRR